MAKFLDRATLDSIHYYVDPSMSLTGRTTEIMGVTVCVSKERYVDDVYVKVLSRFNSSTEWVWAVRWLPNGKDSIAFYGDFELFKNDIIALKMAATP